MSRRLLAFAFSAFVLGCASSQRDTVVVETPWTPEDEAALARLATARPRAAADSLEATPGSPVASRDSLLEIYVFNIGQGDSMLVIGPQPERKTLLIDLGEPTAHSQLPNGLGSSAEHVRARIRELTGESSVDYFLLTHYHSDHAGRGSANTGIIGLLNDDDSGFTVGEFIHVQNDGADFMKEQRTVHRFITRAMPAWIATGRVGRSSMPQFGATQIDLGDAVRVDILSFAGKVPGGASAFQRAIDNGADYDAFPGNENDLSIALQITAGDFELWTGGDLNGTDDPDAHPFFVKREFGELFTNIEHHLVDHWESTNRESDVEIYRANHHGSGFSTTPRLLDALDPELILYSTGADHNHPSNAVVRRGAATARQFATTAVTDRRAFRRARGRIAGEIAIIVAADGKSYTLNGEQLDAFSDDEEANGGDD